MEGGEIYREFQFLIGKLKTRVDPSGTQAQITPKQLVAVKPPINFQSSRRQGRLYCHSSRSCRCRGVFAGLGVDTRRGRRSARHLKVACYGAASAGSALWPGSASSQVMSTNGNALRNVLRQVSSGNDVSTSSRPSFKPCPVNASFVRDSMTAARPNTRTKTTIKIHRARVMLQNVRRKPSKAAVSHCSPAVSK